MERFIYERMAATQDRHWWFVARRGVLASIIASLQKPLHPRILEIGAGTGGNLAMLSSFGEVTACESDAEARQVCEKAGWKVYAGNLPDNLEQIDHNYDLICLFDVLEHVEEDSLAVKECVSRLRPDGGILIVACPAYSWLMGSYDKALGHYRRYTAGKLRKLLEEQGLVIERSGYFNTFLFPLVVLGSLAEKYLGMSRLNALDMPHPLINSTLLRIFGTERWIVGRWLFPFGISTLVAARRMARMVDT